MHNAFVMVLKLSPSSFTYMIIQTLSPYFTSTSLSYSAMPFPKVFAVSEKSTIIWQGSRLSFRKFKIITKVFILTFDIQQVNDSTVQKRPKLWHCDFEPSKNLVVLPMLPIVDLHPWLWNLQLAWCLQLKHSLVQMHPNPHQWLKPTQRNIIKHIILLSNIYWQCVNFHHFAKRKRPSNMYKGFFEKNAKFCKILQKEIKKIAIFLQ